jgi:hypothetical protein
MAAVDHLSMRCDHVGRENRGADYLREERVESDEVLLTDERESPVRWQGVLQRLCRLDSCKSPTDYHEALIHTQRGGAATNGRHNRAKRRSSQESNEKVPAPHVITVSNMMSRST